MDVLGAAFVAFLIIAGLVAIDLLALRFGVDSRDGIGDDRVRRGGS